MLRLFIILTFLVLSFPANACNVPVFRYALERWQPDACEIIVFHDGTFSEQQKSFVQQLASASFENGGVTNVRIRQQHADHEMDDALTTLWESLNADKQVGLPYVVVRSPVGKGGTVNNWHGSLEKAQKAGLLQSPARAEISRRLYRGDSAVWVVLKSGQQERDDAVINLLHEQLKILSRKIPLPEGIGLPGSELFSDIPLLMKFSVFEIDPRDEDEELLITLLHGLDPESKKAGEPLVMPVFGRGRALEVIPAGQVDSGLIEDLTLFLCGACSCQVKERNPGFDLLLDADWNKELFGEGAEDIASKMASTEQDIALPVMLAIPPGATEESTEVPKSIDKSVTEISSAITITDSQSPKTAEPVMWILVVLIGAVLMIVFLREGTG